MFCRRCGLELSSDAKFCPECGEKTGIVDNAILNKEKESRQTNSVAKGVLMVPCITCGKDVSTSAPACPHCGRQWPAYSTTCPRCGSQDTQLIGPQGFKTARAAAGGLLLGPLGLLAGQVGARNIKLKCQSCGNLWTQSVEQVTAGVVAGQKLKGEVIEIKSYGVFVSLPSGTTGMIHISNLSRGYVRKISDIVAVGDEVEVEVLKVDMNGNPSLRASL